MIENTNTEDIENTAETEDQEDCMKDRGNPRAEDCGAAGSAEAEEIKDNTAAAFGKFKSAEALMSAYKNLEAEFTRRSQRLKELESKAGGTPSPKLGKEELLSAALADEYVRNAVIGDYLKTVSNGKSVPLLVSGAPCAAPKSEPKSVKEAGALAKQFLKK